MAAIAGKLLPSLQVVEPSTPTTLNAIRNSRLAFFGLCFYLFAQAYMIPVIPIGPSWAVWFSLADIGAGFLVISVFFRGHSSPSHRIILRGLLVVLFVVTFSYFFQTIWLGLLGVRQMENTEGIIFGMFQIYRLCEFFFIYWSISRIPLTPHRVKILRRIVMGVFLFVCATIFLTFQDTIPTKAFAPQIPEDIEVGGPWSRFYIVNYEMDGLGTIGYDHSYPASQVLLLLALHIHLCGGKRRTLNAWFILIALAAIFVTGSRTVLAGALVFALVMWLEEPRFGVIAAFCLVMGISLFAFQEVGNTSSDSPLSAIVARQSALLDPGSSGFSGRDERWESHLTRLNRSLLNWVVGNGFGATFEFGMHAHMNYLEIISETGFVGLIVAGLFALTVLRTTWAVDTVKQPIFWVTIAFLVTAVTEETFYPIAHKVHFIGFFLCTLAITLRRTDIPDPPPERDPVTLRYLR